MKLVVFLLLVGLLTGAADRLSGGAPSCNCQRGSAEEADTEGTDTPQTPVPENPLTVRARVVPPEAPSD